MTRIATLLLLTLVAATLTFADQTDLNWDQVTIIDVRSKAEWNQSRLEGAIWIPWAQIEQGAKHYELNPDQPIAFYCAAGVRADRAIRRLSRLGYSNTYNLISLQQASQITGRNILQ